MVTVLVLKRAMRSYLVRFLLGVVVLLLVIVLLANGPSRRTWYRDILPWVEPLATVLAVIAATVATVFAVAAYQRERRRDEDREQEGRSAQASLVAAWPVLFNRSGYQDDGAAGYAIRNASELPVRDVHVIWLSGDRDFPLEESRHYHPLVPPSKEPVWIKHGKVHLLEPGEIPVHGGELASSGGVSMLVGLQFRDSANMQWQRDHEGRLQQLPDGATT